MFNFLEKQESLYLFAVNSFLVFNSFFFLFLFTSSVDSHSVTGSCSDEYELKALTAHSGIFQWFGLLMCR